MSGEKQITVERRIIDSDGKMRVGPAESSFAAPSGSASGVNGQDLELLKDAENAIDALLIFGHQHTEKPLLKEMAVLERIRRRLKTPNEKADRPEATNG